MASLLRRTGASGVVSPFWFAKYRGPDGQPIVKTTKQTERKKAQAIADAWELAADRARHGELTKAVILKGMGDLLERTTGERLNIVSTRDFFFEWLKRKESIGRAGSTVKRYKPVVDGFVNFLGESRARASVASVTPTEVEKFRDAQLAEGKGRTTADFTVHVHRLARHVHGFSLETLREILTVTPPQDAHAIAGEWETHNPQHRRPWIHQHQKTTTTKSCWPRKAPVTHRSLPTTTGTREQNSNRPTPCHRLRQRPRMTNSSNRL